MLFACSDWFPGNGNSKAVAAAVVVILGVVVVVVDILRVVGKAVV